MVTVCKEFRDPHKEYTDPGEYCTIEFTWFQLKKKSSSLQNHKDKYSFI